MQQNQSNYNGAAARSSCPHAFNVLLYGTLLFSNKGNRVGMLTYAPETNIAVSSSGELEPEFEHVFFNFSEDEKCAKGKKNLSRCVKIQFFFRGYGNEFCDLIGSLSGQYFPISAHGQR